jgi:glycosyltransferase involved in cell wall biosynthesis
MTPSATPAVSVVIPAYGVTQYIAATIDSVLQQSFPHHEVIVVNDGCPDSGALEDVLRPYAGRIVYLRKENGGPSSARNAGLRLARAPLVTLLDGDDLLLPEYLAVQMDFMQRHPGTDVVYCNGWVFGDSAYAGRKVMDLSPSHGEVTFASLVSCRCSVMATVLARREALLSVGGFDESLRRAEDFDLWVRAAHAGLKIAYHETPLYRYRRRPSSLSTNEVAMRTSALEVLEKLAQTLTLTAAERAALELAEQRFRADVVYFRMTQALHSNDAAGALRAIGELQQSRWKLKYAVLGAGLRWAPRLTLRIADRRVR